MKEFLATLAVILSVSAAIAGGAFFLARSAYRVGRFLEVLRAAIAANQRDIAELQQYLGEREGFKAESSRRAEEERGINLYAKNDLIP